MPPGNAFLPSISLGSPPPPPPPRMESFLEKPAELTGPAEQGACESSHLPKPEPLTSPTPSLAEHTGHLPAPGSGGKTVVPPLPCSEHSEGQEGSLWCRKPATSDHHAPPTGMRHPAAWGPLLLLQPQLILPLTAPTPPSPTVPWGERLGQLFTLSPLGLGNSPHT